MRWLARIAAVTLAGLMGLSACAGASDEERCKVSGGAWREALHRCEASSR